MNNILLVGIDGIDNLIFINIGSQFSPTNLGMSLLTVSCGTLYSVI